VRQTLIKVGSDSIKADSALAAIHIKAPRVATNFCTFVCLQGDVDFNRAFVDHDTESDSEYFEAGHPSPGRTGFSFALAETPNSSSSRRQRRAAISI
jgi:hypothetical protein